jgi:hypothetical protein
MQYFTDSLSRSTLSSTSPESPIFIIICTLLSSVRHTLSIALKRLSNSSYTVALRNNEIQHTKAKLRDVLKKKWKNKDMHGQILAAQGQALQKKYYSTKILNTEIDGNAGSATNLMRQVTVESVSIVTSAERSRREVGVEVRPGWDFLIDRQYVPYS